MRRSLKRIVEKYKYELWHNKDKAGWAKVAENLCLEEIGQRIITRRKKLGLTQEALAERANFTIQFVSYAELSKRAMRPENLLKLSAALEVSADYLLTGQIIDKDFLLLSQKLQLLAPSQIHIIENLIDECISLMQSNQ